VESSPWYAKKFTGRSGATSVGGRVAGEASLALFRSFLTTRASWSDVQPGR